MPICHKKKLSLDFVSKKKYIGYVEEKEKEIFGKAYKLFYNDKENLLHALRRGTERYPYVKEILLILAAGTVISAAFLMPGVARLLSPSVWQGREYKRNRLGQVLKRFRKQKIIEVVDTSEGPIVRITQNGLMKALKYKLGEMKIKSKDTWDKKWRVVIFDIPEAKKRLRDEFREKLKQVGFYQLQKSVFVHAFPCADEIEFLRQVYRVDIDVTTIIASHIEGEDRIKDFFHIE